MIFPTEVEAILDDLATDSEIQNFLQHYELGGFHQEVSKNNKEKFKKWIETRAVNEVKELPIDFANIGSTSQQIVNEGKEPVTVKELHIFLQGIMGDNFHAHYVPLFLVMAYKLGQLDIINKVSTYIGKNSES